MKENELFSFIWMGPAERIAPDSVLVGFRPFSENLGKVSSETRNVGKSFSACHLKKQRLINSLEAEVDERYL